MTLCRRLSQQPSEKGLMVISSWQMKKLRQVACLRSLPRVILAIRLRVKGGLLFSGNGLPWTPGGW